MKTENEPTPEIVSEAAADSAEATAAAIDHAVDLNDDPHVAQALDEASASAHATVGRVSWLRSFVRRVFGRR
jgi:hypothetical protein